MLDKEHAKSYKKMKAVVKKKSQAVEKLSKKVKKKAGDAELCGEQEVRLRELSITGDVWVDRERAAVRDIQVRPHEVLRLVQTGPDWSTPEYSIQRCSQLEWSTSPVSYP